MVIGHMGYTGQLHAVHLCKPVIIGSNLRRSILSKAAKEDMDQAIGDDIYC